MNKLPMLCICDDPMDVFMGIISCYVDTMGRSVCIYATESRNLTLCMPLSYIATTKLVKSLLSPYKLACNLCQYALLHKAALCHHVFYTSHAKNVK